MKSVTELAGGHIIVSAASIENTHFIYINGFILEACHMSIASMIISVHGNVNISQFIKNVTGFF